MNAFLIVQLVLSAIAIWVKLGHLGRAEYPREITMTSRDDVANVIINLTLAIWAAWLMWGPTGGTP